MNETVLYSYTLGMQETIGLAVILLLLGRFIKNKIQILQKFFIPAPIVGGLIFSILTLIGYSTGTFKLSYDETLKNLLMMAFFTTVGFSASIRMLVQGGISVVVFLFVSVLLIFAQNGAGIGLSVLFGLDPLMGLAAGSISMTGGYGTAGAFGPLLEQNGLNGGLSVSIAAATYGLIAGCMIGGPIGRKLMSKYNLQPTYHDDNAEIVEGKLTKEQKNIDEKLLFKAVAYIIICMGLGHYITVGFASQGIVLPNYLGPMLVAALFRNIVDMTNNEIPLHSINVVGGLALQIFLAIALMTMDLWKLADLAVPLITILLVQTVIMAVFAYFITFNIMGRDYDAAVIAIGQCGFGMGATPNAIANMETFTTENGYSPKAFFVVPLVGSLFIDFVNATLITMTLAWL